MNHEQGETLTRVSTLVEDMHHRLFGNGQPGIIKDFDMRLKELEQVKHRGQGALWTTTAIVAIIEFVQLFLGKK